MPDAPHRLANISRGIHPPLGTSLVRGGGAEGSAALTFEADRTDALAWLMPGTGGVWSDRTLLRVDTSAWTAFSALNMTFGNGTIRTNFVFQGAGALRVTQLNDTQRGNLLSVANGMIIYNTTSNELQARINGAWVALGSGGGATTLDGLSDVVIAAPATGELLRYNGTNWVNSVLQGTRSILFEINDDATAGTNEDPSLILSGGNGSTVLVNSALGQDSSAQTVFLYTTANGTVANHTFALGRPNATSTTSRTTTLQLYAADGATERSHSLVMATGGGLTWTIPSGIGNSFVLTDGFRNYLAVSPNTQAVVMGSGSGATFSFGLVPSALNAFAVSDYLYVHTDTTNRRVAIGTATTLQVGSFTTTQRDALSTLINGMLLYNTTSNELQARINGTWVALGAGGGTLDAAYDFGGAGAGRTITVDSGAIRLSYPDAADTHYALEIAYGAQAFTGTPHGILVDWTAATSLNNAADVYGAHLIGETNAGAGDSIGIRLDGWDQDIEIAGDNIHIGNGGGPAGSQTVLVGTNLTGGTGAECVYIGDNIAGGSGSRTIAIGADITGAGASQQVGIGYSVDLGGAGATAVGWSAEASANTACAFGYNARAAHNFSVAIGRQSVTSAASQIMIGSSATNFTDFCVGGGNVSTTPSTITLRPSDGSSAAGWSMTVRAGDGAGTNQPGGHLTLRAGNRTGSGLHGEHRKQANSVVERWLAGHVETTGATATAITEAQFAVPQGASNSEFRAGVFHGKLVARRYVAGAPDTLECVAWHFSGGIICNSGGAITVDMADSTLATSTALGLTFAVVDNGVGPGTNERLLAVQVTGVAAQTWDWYVSWEIVYADGT